MEPFTIQCSTCQSIIRVRNPKMIGQIVNCPKCNSMLQITKPEANHQPSGQSGDARQIRVESHRGIIDSSAMTKEAFAPELEDEYRLAPSLNQEPGNDGLAGLIAPPKVDDEPMFQEPFSAPPISTSVPPSQKSMGATGSLPADSNHIQLLAVRRTARRRQLLMIAVFGSSGVLLAGMVFVGFLYWYTAKPKSTVAKNSTVANQGANETKHVGPKREPDQAVFNDPLSESGFDPLAEPSLTPPESDKTLTESSENTAETGETKSISSAILNATSSDTTQSEPKLNEPKSNDTKPNALNIDESTPKANEQVVAPKSVDAAELPEQLKKFQSILNTTIEPQFLEDQAIQKAPPTAKELGLSSGQDSKALPAVDLSKQLKLIITGLIVPPGSVSNAVSQWVQVSGVPTVVDLDSLVAAGVDPNRAIGKIQISVETPLDQVASSIAKEIGVDTKVFENQFLAFQASETAIRDRMPTSIKISDLVANDEQQQWLVKVLDQIWPEYEGKWMVRDGELTVDPNVIDALAWFWSVRMLESWRIAAGVETQLDKTKLDPSKFVTKFADPDAIPALNKPMSLSLVNRAPVAQLIAELSAASKMDVWVDWVSVGQKGLGPNSIDFIVTKDRKLRQCLRDFAEKYSLYVACENEKSIVITTPEVYRAQPRLYVLPSQGKTAEQWMDELQSLTPATAAAAQPILAFLTPGKDFVIVRCCRPRIRN